MIDIHEYSRRLESARLRAFYESVARRRGDGKVVVAIATKMFKIIWFMLTRREPYQSRDVRLYAVVPKVFLGSLLGEREKLVLIV
ncbi:hypothetical protein J7L29_04610 [Candidatus Bathyarchaeota archaeon]|nr:hypothetical protein [Candidatus Bathyarchaeota archaeon]